MLVVAVALIDGDGRCLMQQRSHDKRHGGLWEFPGGKVEPGEHPDAALVRELAEELAIEVAADAERVLEDRTAPLCVMPGDPIGGVTFGAIVTTMTGAETRVRLAPGRPSPGGWRDLDWSPVAVS